MGIRGVIFDLDGTLLDTEGISKRSIAKIVAQFGKEFPESLRKQILGRPSSEWTRMVLDGLNISDADLSPLELAQQWEHNMHEMMAEVEVLPGALELLRRLHALNVPMALGTSSSSAAVSVKRRYHEELFSYFSVIVCGNDAAVLRGKPAPDIFLVAAQRLHAHMKQNAVDANEEPEEEPLPKYLVFEDSVLGIQAGNAAGMHTIAIPDTRIHDDSEEREKLFQHADEILTSLEHFDPTKYGWK